MTEERATKRTVEHAMRIEAMAAMTIRRLLNVLNSIGLAQTARLLRCAKCRTFQFRKRTRTHTNFAGPQPDPRNYAWRDYGLRVGIWRIFDLMDQLGLPLCHLLNASICDRFPQIVERIRSRGDEVVGHGYTNSTPVGNGCDRRGGDDPSCNRDPYPSFR